MKKLGCIWLALFIVVSFFYCENADAQEYTFAKNYTRITKDSIDISANNQAVAVVCMAVIVLVKTITMKISLIMFMRNGMEHCIIPAKSTVIK